VGRGGAREIARTNYRKGYDLENDVQNALIKKGYCTIRSAGSHGIIDVLGYDGTRRLAIQCKVESSPFTKEHQDELLRRARLLSAMALLVEKKNHKTSWYFLGTYQDNAGKIRVKRTLYDVPPADTGYLPPEVV
jgi:Holliday junction resolvase